MEKKNKTGGKAGATAILAGQRSLLQLEYDSEKKAFSEAADRIGVERLAEKGFAWYPVELGTPYHNSLNQRIVEVRRHTESESDPEDHTFEYGRPVMFFTTGGDGRILPQSRRNGTVSLVDGDRMLVEIPENMVIPDNGAGNGIMLSFDETSYRVMFDALERTASAKGRLGELRDLVYSRRPAGFLSCPPLKFRYLNGSQENAVNNVIAAKDVAIVHGPPGTGKTTTLVEAIYETLRRESQVLVCAQSNSAVDLICERLSDRGINVLRIGNPARVNDRMLASTYERRFEAHPDYPTLWSIRKTIRELRTSRRHSEQWHQKMDRLRSRATDLEFRINTQIMGEARVIASTLIGSAHRLLDGMKFSTLFIDEAAQAMEAASWVPVRRAGRLILAGDHCQLPPTVKCYEAMRQGLGKSLMKRIAENHPEAVTLLGVQYRMHEDIMRFSSEWFYNGAMTADVSVKGRSILDLDSAVEWIESSAEIDGNEGERATASFREALSGQSYGRINTDEALLTITTLQNYAGKIGIRRIIDENIDIAVISPYRAQVRYLRNLIRNTPFFKSFRHLVTVSTVDGFQGRESDVVVISLVRSNESGQIGFLRDLRRMNVAMTRARMKLIIIGNSGTLCRHPFYRRLHAYICAKSKEGGWE